ncbi:hypothetical protein ACOMHN_035970 [Nucella lapillus]
MRYSRDQLLEIQPSTPNFELVNRLRELSLGVGLPRKRGCRGGRKKLRSIQVVPSRNIHPLMVPPFLQPHPDLQSAVGNAPLSSKHPTQIPTTDCLLSIIPLMGGQPSDAPALSPPSPLQQGGQSSNAPALSPLSPLPQGGQPIALALSPSSPPPQDSQPSDAPGLSPSSSTLLLCSSDSTLSICHLNSQSAVKTGKPETISDYILEQKLDIMILTETWLSETGHETSCKLMTPSGFVLKSYPRASKGEGIPELGRADLDTGAASPWHSPLSWSDYRLQLAPLKSSLQPVFAFVRFDSSSLRAFSHSMGDIIVHDLRAFYHTTEIRAL